MLIGKGMEDIGLFYKFIQGRVHALVFYKFIQGRGSCISIL